MCPAEPGRSEPPRSPLLGRTAPRPAGRPVDHDNPDSVCPICGASIPLGQGVLRDDDTRVHIECFDGVTRWVPSTRQ